MSNLTTWDYAESVKTMKVMVMKWSTLTVEMVAGLYKARQELSSAGSRTDLVPNGTRLTWAGYLSEVGLARTTVHNWLERYVPAENKLITVEELETRKAQETRRAQEDAKSENQKRNDRINLRIKTGKVSSEWDEKDDARYEEEIAFQKRMREAQARVSASDAAREASLKESADRLEELRKKIESFNEDMISGSIGSMVQKNIEANNKRQSFKESIRVSHEGQDDPFVDAIMDYLDGLDDDNRRVEACYNIIKVCKGIAIKLQKEEAAS